MPDGSYIEIEDNRTTLYGEGYLVRNGRIDKICENGESLDLSNESDIEKMVLLKRIAAKA